MQCANLMKIQGVRIAAICDEGHNRAASLVNRLGKNRARTYVDYEEMLNGEDMDAVFILSNSLLGRIVR